MESLRDPEIKTFLERLDSIAKFDIKKIEEYKDIILQAKNNQNIRDFIKSTDNNSFTNRIRQAYTCIMRKWMEFDNKIESIQECKELIKLVFWTAKQEIIDNSRALKFVEDIFESVSLNQIRLLFEVIEYEIVNMASSSGHDNTMLKLCNHIFKNLSKTQDVELRGRLHIFLTKMLPLCHPSGQNLKGLINPYHSLQIDEQNEFSDQDKSKRYFDYAKYRSFWGLQKYFHDPSKLFSSSADEDIFPNPPSIDPEKEKNLDKDQQIYYHLNIKIKRICEIIQGVLHIFKEYKIDESHTANKRYPKFLTIQQLMQIQLNDAFFRKIICVQMILFFHTIKNPGKSIKFKVPFKDEVRACLKLICKNLKEKNLADQIDAFLEQETFWQSLKDQGGKEENLPFQPAPQHPEIFESFQKFQKQQANKDINKTVLSSFYKESVSDYCAKGFEFQDKFLENLRTHKIDKFGDQYAICKLDSQVKKIMEYDKDQVLLVPTEPMECVCGYYFDQIFHEMLDKEIQNEFKIKENKIHCWKSLRTLARFDITQMRNDSKKDELLNLEDVSNNIINAYGSQEQKDYFKQELKKISVVDLTIEPPPKEQIVESKNKESKNIAKESSDLAGKNKGFKSFLEEGEKAMDIEQNKDSTKDKNEEKEKKTKPQRTESDKKQESERKVSGKDRKERSEKDQKHKSNKDSKIHTPDKAKKRSSEKQPTETGKQLAKLKELKIEKNKTKFNQKNQQEEVIDVADSNSQEKPKTIDEGDKVIKKKKIEK